MKFKLDLEIKNTDITEYHLELMQWIVTMPKIGMLQHKNTNIITKDGITKIEISFDGVLENVDKNNSASNSPDSGPGPQQILNS